MNFKRILCLILCLCFVFGAVSKGVFNADAVEGESEYRDKIDQINSQITGYEDKLSTLASDTAKQKEYLETLEAQIEAIEEKADELRVQISELNADISELTVQYNQLKNEIAQINKNIQKANVLIANTEKQISDNKYLLSAKLRSAYMNGNQSTLKILMGSDSLASFLTRLEMMKRTSENDKKTIDAFKNKITALNKAKLQLEEDKQAVVEKQQQVVETREKYVVQKAALQENQNEYTATLTTVEAKYADVETLIASLDKESALYQSYITNLKQQEEEANAQLESFLSNYYATSTTTTRPTTTLPVYNQDDSEDDYGYEEPTEAPAENSGSSGGNYETSDTWAWPVGNISYYISAYFLDPSYLASIGSNHYGVDITGGGFYGTPIYAARAGTVIVSDYMASGYGYYVMIDHGDGYVSLYGHNSQLLVSVGETVSKGQLIAYAGSTGFSSGAHLHFEIRYNGSAVDPANFYPGYI